MDRIRAVLFDIDGTLLDSNDASAHAWLDALRGHGKEVPYDRVRSAIGGGGAKLLREVADIDADSVLGRSINDRRIAILKAHYVPDLGPHPGARALVDRIRSRGLVCAAVSSAGSAEIDDLLKAAAVFDLIDLVVSSNDADPESNLVDVALERLRIEPNEAIFVGDTRYDVAAATRVGMPIIAFRCGGSTDDDLEGALAIYDGPADLLTHFGDSPIAQALESTRPPPFPRRSAAREY